MNFVSGIERHMECQFLFGCTHLEIHCLLPNPHCSTSREAELDPAGALEELDPDGGARPRGSSTCQSWRGELDPSRRPGGTRPRWRSPTMGSSTLLRGSPAGGRASPRYAPAVGSSTSPAMGSSTPPAMGSSTSPDGGHRLASMDGWTEVDWSDV